MLYRYLSNGAQGILMLVLTLPAILIALTFHEYAHGLVSYWNGDPTAKNLGRLTLNPLKHIDWIGFVCMLVVGFGWAKPVPVNSRYYKNPKLGMALTAAAGPVMNFLLAFVSVFFMELSGLIYTNQSNHSGITIAYAAYLFFYVLASLNLYLAVFNLIPIPPLDGSRILFIFLPTKWYFGIMKYERIIMIVFYVFLLFGTSLGILSTISDTIMDGMIWLIHLIPIFK